MIRAKVTLVTINPHGYHLAILFLMRRRTTKQLMKLEKCKQESVIVNEEEKKERSSTGLELSSPKDSILRHPAPLF